MTSVSVSLPGLSGESTSTLTVRRTSMQLLTKTVLNEAQYKADNQNQTRLKGAVTKTVCLILMGKDRLEYCHVGYGPLTPVFDVTVKPPSVCSQLKEELS